MKGVNSPSKAAILGTPQLLAMETESRFQKPLPAWDVQMQFWRSQCH